MSHILLPPGKYGIWLIFLLPTSTIKLLNYLDNLYTVKEQYSTQKVFVDYVLCYCHIDLS